jgi:hypothetical protein
VSAGNKRKEPETLTDACEPAKRTKTEDPCVLVASGEPRSQLESFLVSKGYKWRESTGTRAVFEDGSYESFLKDCREWASEHNALFRVLRVSDPGVGAIVDYSDNMHPLKVINDFFDSDRREKYFSLAS